jgi:hypothetical protein
MCDPISASIVIGLGAGAGMSYLQNKNNKKDKAQMNARINSLEQAAQDQVEANKLANSVQATDPSLIEEPKLKDKLAAQKIPLNTTNTGLAVGNGLSTGLNLGGY